MLDGINDPHAAYLDPEQYSMQRENIQGYFEGIGAHVDIQNGLITIVAPIPDTPADKAGIRSGDVILRIDGESIEGWDLFQVINRIRGEEGTPCGCWCAGNGPAKRRNWKSSAASSSRKASG